MTQTVHNIIAKVVFTLAACFFYLFMQAQSAPELMFRNPVLQSGRVNKEGAVYRFANVTAGVDAEIKLKKFSRSTIVMETVDGNSVGWDKAFQPKFGLSGSVDPNQNWYVDFELSFYKVGTRSSYTMPKVDFTSLDMDGDGNSISEYTIFQAPNSIDYSTRSILSANTSISAGQTLTCDDCGVTSALTKCPSCNGTGNNGNNDCSHCNGSGLEFSRCRHGYDGVAGTIVQGPIQTFSNIDTISTQVMVTYHYTNTNQINFRYGAKSNSSRSSNDAGVRMYSVWAKTFVLAPQWYFR